MKFIHIADLHLGAEPDAGRAYSQNRSQELWETLQSVLEVCEEEQTDLLLIAGDIFHGQPLRRELKELNYYFAELTHTKVVLIAGNHDYIRKDSYYRTFQWNENVIPLFGRELEYVEFPELRTAVYGLSYYSREIREPLYESAFAGGIQEYEILLAHGGDEKHCPFRVKKLEESGFDYIALGHIHRPQSLSEKVRYCGSPLKYSFSEAKYDKTVTIFDADDFSVQTIPLKPLHDMRMIKGSIENILSKEVINAADSDDYLHITLTDKDNIIDAMDKVRSAYPNVMQLEFERDMKGNTKGVYEATGVGTKPDNELFYDFYKLQNGVEIDSEKAELVDSILEEVKEN